MGMVTPSDAIGPLARRPAVTAAVLLVAGILLHERLPPRATLVALGVVIAAAIACVSRRYVASALVAVAVVLGGMALAQREHFAYAADDVGLFATDDARLATVEASIVDEPQLIAGADVGGRPFPPRQTFVADVSRVLTNHGWTPARGQLPVRVNQPNPALAAGQSVRLLGMLERPNPAANPGEFDWAVYYRRLRITATLTVPKANNATVLAAPNWNPLRSARTKVRHALAAGFGADHLGDFVVLQALLLGDRDPQLRDTAADFEQTGVAYQLSASGLHLVLLAAGVVWACRRLRLHPRTTLIMGTTFTVAYALLASPSHSGLRSVIACATFAVALFSRRWVDRPQLVSLAIIAMLVGHPMDLFSEGFQLSLAVVVAFVLLLPAARRRWAADPDKRTKSAERPTLARRAWRSVLNTACYAVVAWLATLPLSATYFGRVTLWVVVVDLAVYPLVVVALYAGAGKVLLTLLWPSSAGLTATVVGWPVAAMRGVAHAFAQLPGGSVPAAPPPLWAVLLFYAVLLVPLVPVDPLRRRLRSATWLSPAAGLAGLLAVSLGSTPAVSNSGGLRLTLLSVGAGQCGVVELPDGRAVVIDAGSSTVPEVAARAVEPYFQSRGIRTVASVFLSHGDFDHVSAAAELAGRYDPAAVYTSGHFRRHAVGNDPDLDLLARLDELHLPPRELSRGDHVDLGSDGATVDVLWPPPVGDYKSNDAGLVLRLTYAGRRILLPADVQDVAFAELLKHPNELAADVLVAPHHGSGESLTPAFLAAVHPAVIVASSAARLTAKQRRFDQIVNGTVPEYRTAACGAIAVTVAPNGRVGVGTYLSTPVGKQ